MIAHDKIENTDGHGGTRRGRFASAGARDALTAAMWSLMRIGGVDAHSRAIQIDGRAVHVLLSGAGPDLVMMHGASGGAANWYRLIAALSAHFRVCAVDLPGFGLSDSIAPSSPLSIPTCNLLTSLFAKLEVEPRVVVGTSFGALLAMRLAQQMPTIAALVLLDAAGLGAEVPTLLRLSALRGFGRLAFAPSRRGAAWILNNLVTSDLSRMSESEENALTDYLWLSARVGNWRGMHDAVRCFQSRGRQREVLSDRELGALTLPTLLIWGEEDRFFPFEHGIRASQKLPDSQLAVLPGIGHSPNWEAPEEVLRLTIPFLLARARVVV